MEQEGLLHGDQFTLPPFFSNRVLPMLKGTGHFSPP